MVQERDDIVALDSAILQHPRVWEASGHLEGFTDPLVQCLGKCKKRWREDHLREAVEAEGGDPSAELRCPECGGELSEPRQFNLMFETHVGPVADELSHYSSGTSDVEYLFPIGWSELEGIANRGDFDLTQHAKFSGEKLEYFDQQTKERYVPHVIEPAAGADRATLAFLVDAYEV